MRPNEVSYNVIGAAMKVHSALGAGIVESAYDTALCYELTQAGLQFQHQVRLPLSYQGNRLSPAYRIDFIVEKSLIVELKSVEKGRSSLCVLTPR
jgi:GxxExxY protein